MRILYIFPHPDDESFGPAGAIRQQILDGHEVFLLTLTKGGATKQRFRLNLSVEEMGNVRLKEMECVAEILGLTGMNVLDLPDSGLMDMDPREIERVIEAEIQEIKPSILVTYPVHGVSGFYDHLVCHAVVKRVFLKMRDDGADYLKRLAFLAVAEPGKEKEGIFKLNFTPPERIACLMQVSEAAHQAFNDALDCYVTYTDTIDRSKIRDLVTRDVPFAIFQESFQPPLARLTDNLN